MATRAIAAVLRILIGAALIFLGAQKLSDINLLYGGLMHRIYDLGEPFAFYQQFLIRFVEFRQEKIVYAVAIGEILVGTSFVFGALVSLGALAGAFLLANFALATTAGNLPMLIAHLCAIAVLLMLGRGGAGLTWGLDGWLVQRINEAIVLFPLRRRLPPVRTRLVAQPQSARRPVPPSSTGPRR